MPSSILAVAEECLPLEVRPCEEHPMKLRLKLVVFVLMGFAILMNQRNVLGQSATNSPASNAASQIPVTFTGGYETDPQDRGRPVILIAAALNVSAEVFRKAFSNVKPAPAGQTPEPDQVRKNKQVLMESLSPYGVTDDRLNTVSNYYRYSRSKGEMWRHVPATAYATVLNGVVTGITLTNPGAGYSSPPKASLAGMPDVTLTVTLSYGTDLEKNGSIKEVALGAPSRPAAP